MSDLVSRPRPATGRVGQGVHAAILGMSTACPPAVKQEDTAQLASTLTCQNAQQTAWVERVFMHSGIATRGSVLAEEGAPIEGLRKFYPAPGNADDRGPGTAARMARYATEAPVLAHAAARGAISDAGLAPTDITHLITVSCTGFFSPGLDAALIRSLSLRPTVHRLHVGFMGCHAAFNALAAARDAALANPGARVLMCCVELSSVHFAYGWDPGRMVANALFADGAAALVVGGLAANASATTSARHPWHILDTTSFLMPDCPDAMTWRIGDHGFEMTLLPSVPELVRTHVGPWCREWLAEHELSVGEVRGWAVHPGGPKVLAAIGEALDLPRDALGYSRDVLLRHGNMSSATVLFILDEMTKARVEGPCVAIGLGPGLMAEGLLLDRCILD